MIVRQSRSDTALTPDPERLLAAWTLGLLDADEAAAVERAVRSTPAMRRRARRLSAGAAVASLSVIQYEEDDAPPAQVELRLVQRAREARPPAERPRPYASPILRAAPWLAVLGVVALVAIFGWLAFQPQDPISGRAVPLSDDGATGVLLPRYESRGFALVFWGLPALEDGETWQLWYVRASGAVESGPIFAGGDQGRAAVALDPNELETSDPLIGFAVSRDIPEQRTAATPPRDVIRYQFPSR